MVPSPSICLNQNNALTKSLYFTLLSISSLSCLFQQATIPLPFDLMAAPNPSLLPLTLKSKQNNPYPPCKSLFTASQAHPYSHETSSTSRAHSGHSHLHPPLLCSFLETTTTTPAATTSATPVALQLPWSPSLSPRDNPPEPCSSIEVPSTLWSREHSTRAPSEPLFFLQRRRATRRAGAALESRDPCFLFSSSADLLTYLFGEPPKQPEHLRRRFSSALGGGSRSDPACTNHF